jgi:hypothetical protein
VTTTLARVADSEAVAAARVSGLVETVRDAFSTRPGSVIAAPDDLIAPLSARLPIHSFAPLAKTGEANAVVLTETLHIDSLTGVREALDQLLPNGVVLATLHAGGFSSLHREEISFALGVRWPGLVFRTIDRGRVATTRGLTPWVAIRQRRPRAWLILGASNMGKTSAINDLAHRSGLPVLRGDTIIAQIETGELPVPDALRAAVLRVRDLGRWQPYIEALFDDGLFEELARILTDRVGPRDFILEMWLPVEYRHVVPETFERLGYFPFMPQADLLAEPHRLHAKIAAIHASRSWRITAPLRQISRAFSRLRRPD